MAEMWTAILGNHGNVARHHRYEARRGPLFRVFKHLRGWRTHSVHNGEDVVHPFLKLGS